MDDNDYQQWKRDSLERQQLSYTRFGDREWDEILTRRVDHLRTKISWYVFNKNYEDLLETDEKKEKSTVDETIIKLKNLSADGTRLLLGCVYVDIFLKNKEASCIIPLLKAKIPNDGRTIIYELHSGRVYYGGWKAYVEENKLPKCWMCYPREGTYRLGESGRVRCTFDESRSCHTILPMVDTISFVGGILCTAVMAIQSFLFPPLLAVAGTGVLVSGGYGLTRGVCDLLDRNAHDQSCGLFDSEAFRQWLSVITSAGCILTAGGSLMTRAATFTNTGGRCATAIRFAVTVLRYMSVGINGLGIVVIIIDLVVKFMNNRLQTSDLNVFKSVCLLVANIAISTGQAERVIEFVANHPQCIRNAFNMVRNAVTSTVKAIREYVPWEEILYLITGDVAMTIILRHIGLPRTATMISFIRNRIRRVRNRDVVNIVFALQDILKHCFLFFGEILLEVQEALSKVEKWFNVALPDFVIGSRRIFFNYSSDVALEVTDEVDRVLDDMELLEPSIRNDEARNIVAVVNNVANEVECSTEAEYMAITELVCARLGNMCNTEINLQRHNPTDYLTDDRKSELFRKILSHFEQSSGKREIEERFRSKRENFSAVSRKNLIFYKPVYQSAQNSVYYFERSSESFTFSQFVYDAACELLGTDDLFEEGREFHFHDYETIFCVRDGDRSLIFNYEIEKKNGKVRGIVITDEQEKMFQ